MLNKKNAPCGAFFLFYYSFPSFSLLKLYDLLKSVLDVDINGFLVGRSGGIVKTKLFAFERIAIIGQKHCIFIFVHAERPFAIGQKVANRVPRPVTAPLAFKLTANLAASPFTIFVCTGIVSTMNEYASEYPVRRCRRKAGSPLSR